MPIHTTIAFFAVPSTCGRGRPGRRSDQDIGQLMWLHSNCFMMSQYGRPPTRMTQVRAYHASSEHTVINKAQNVRCIRSFDDNGLSLICG